MRDFVGSDQPLAAFRARLMAEGFMGEFADDIATRSVHATDNSIYELMPQVVIFPRDLADLNRIARAANACLVAVTAKGGGTGTNGQSLTGSVAVDCSRHLTQIEEINTEEGYAIVQPGVILDQLNRAADAFGLFFAPTVSTASRATLGGMAATDASGKGSRIYGRTSDHVQAMDVVLVDGTDMTVLAGGSGPLERGVLATKLVDILAPLATEIKSVFPVMNRGLSGYNLQEALVGTDLSMIKLLCGSEGTLALTKRLKLRLLPKPTHRALIVCAYDNVDAALRDVRRLVVAEPAAIEFIDDKILSLAQLDPIWSTISDVLAYNGPRRVRGLNFVEVIGNSEADIAAGVARMDRLAPAPGTLIGQRTVTDPDVVAELWQLRAKCVGLLGRMDPTRQGTPFVEDAAVPAQNLAEFVAGFREMLDGMGLHYGMFGHADVGCVHVRPALDMRRPEDAAMIRKVSDAVNQLAKKYGGLIWGEHGKGFRGEYGPDVFGPQLYTAMCAIKALFDPHNLLNPGKLAAPTPQLPLTSLDAVPFRGPMDATISPKLTQDYELAIKCNGNAQCMGQDIDDAMCPSYKATGDRLRAPKGRAAMLRQWARWQSDPVRPPEFAALEATLHTSLSDCLGCKACSSQCPVKVDIPKMRSRFYAAYFARHRRPLRHHFLAALEPLGALLRAAPRASNLGLRIAAPILRQVGLIDLPMVRPHRAKANDRGTRGKVLLIADSFLATFDGAVIEAAAEVLIHLGYAVRISKPLQTGKPLHVIGASGFADKADRSMAFLKREAARGWQLVALEPAFFSMFCNEYKEIRGDLPEVIALDVFLQSALRSFDAVKSDQVYTLFTHCSETAADPQTAVRWEKIFAGFGLSLTPAKTGCCGMAGTFGHEVDKQAMSERLYDLSWRAKIDAAGEAALATGFSCRCQVKRFAARRPAHPVETLRDSLSG